MGSGLKKYFSHWNTLLLMKEEFIHFLWKYRLFKRSLLKTTRGEVIEIIHPGDGNTNSGPDFSAAKVKIDGTLWAGNIEMHLQSSDWFRHGHQHDQAYQNIILHVVYKHDKEITDSLGRMVPVFEVAGFIDPFLPENYEKIIQSKTWIPCANYIQEADNFIMMNWLSRLLVDRLERKAGEIISFLEYFEQNWEKTFYYFLARNFGFKVNSSPFGLLAQKTPYMLLSKHKNDLTQLEALLFGQAGLLANNFNDAYPEILKREYHFLKHKYNLEPLDSSLWKLGRLRPTNFPTIRIAQFARLINQSSGLFSKLMHTAEVEEIYKLFSIQCSPYWSDHFKFDVLSKKSNKSLGKSAIDNIIINTVVPMKFVYGRENMKPEIKDDSLMLISKIQPEDNKVIKYWKMLSIHPRNASESQALLELKKNYCTPRKCLHCAIGLHLIRSKPVVDK